MEFLFELPVIAWLAFVFVLGTGVGSFLNVLVIRLPFEKSVIWPGSHCFACLKPIHIWDNLPIIGYLRLRGRCRMCGAAFSPRYLLVELFTGLAFVGLFAVEILSNWHSMPGLTQPLRVMRFGLPTWPLIGLFLSHALLLSLLIACSLVDLDYRVIPHQITYTGTALGLIFSTLLPWPWPSLDATTLGSLPTVPSWILVEAYGKIPTGATLWPFWGPLPDWAPAGSPQLGLLNGLCGAAAGMLIGRGVKNAFEIGMGREALGLGDADLMMMAGAFLGWQAITLSLFVGAFLTLFIVIPQKLLAAVRGRQVGSELPFGPGIAGGIVVCWFGWPWLSQLLQPLMFDLIIVGFFVIVMGGGMLIAGLFLRRGDRPDSTS
jgi:leader peptidase (prepilin peptidase)/N-methyltransferase